MKNKTTTWNALRGLALAGVLGAISAGQSAKAVFIFDVVDADTFTITASGSSVPNGIASIYWGSAGFLSGGTVTLSNGASGPISAGYGSTSSTTQYGEVTSVELDIGDPFSGGGTIPDGGVVTVNYNGDSLLDFTTITLPSGPLALGSFSSGVVGADNSLVFSPVPEPSSTAILAFGGCAMLLRRRRA